jgi:hypothetical protein
MKHSRKTRLELLADRQGLSLAARLNPAASDLPHEVTERLRAARERALASRKVQTARAQGAYGMGGSLALNHGDDDQMGWLGRLSSGLALLLLVVGMLGISEAQNDSRARELAEVDVALLTDDLPPAAFADPGFLQFLQTDDL